MNSQTTTSHRLVRALRRYAGVLVGGLLLLSYTGCDSLDVVDPNAPNPDDVSLQALVTGVEGGMRASMSFYWRVTGIFGRELYYFEPADPRYTGELYAGPLDPGGFLLTNTWASRYQTVQQAVVLMEQAESRLASGDIEAAEKAGIDGFAKTIIAYQLLLNLNYLGENGIKIEFSEDVNTPFVSREAAFDEIDRYLDEAIGDLGNAGGSFAFSLSGGFAGFNTPADFATFNQALQARVAIYRENPEAALAALEASFVDESAPMDLGVYYVFGGGSGDRLNPMFESPDAPAPKLRAHPDFAAEAEEGDTRFTSKIFDRSGDEDFEASPAAANGLSSALIPTVAASSTAPYPLIRNEELLLIRAEAYIRQNDLESAEDDINTVRAAAGLDPVEITAGNAIDQLLHERFYSLFAEGHRWIDLRRFGRLDTLPRDVIQDPAGPSLIFTYWPCPQNEVPQGATCGTGVLP